MYSYQRKREKLKLRIRQVAPPEMTVFGHSGAGGGFRAGKQVFPVDEEAEVSQRLVEASVDDDLKSALECIGNPLVDVNYVGDVCLKVRKTEVLLREELPNEVRVELEEYRTDVTALFLAVHNGNIALVRKLLVTANFTRFRILKFEITFRTILANFYN